MKKTILKTKTNTKGKRILRYKVNLNQQLVVLGFHLNFCWIPN